MYGQIDCDYNQFMWILLPEAFFTRQYGNSETIPIRTYRLDVGKVIKIDKLKYICIFFETYSVSSRAQPARPEADLKHIDCIVRPMHNFRM